ncbi:aldo/keto reductase [Sphingomonas sp.]|uniref:aldo/keto reductase n=1 Tax=Sphingomonas sp. TaxID=28214 RepID=UPI002EDA92C8
MELRRLGRTGIEVSKLTLGAAALKAADADEAASIVALALDRGINAIEVEAGDEDLAILLGGILREQGATHRVQVIARLTSLVRFDLPSPHVLADQAYPGSHIRAETEALLGRLGVERLALQQLHAWCPEWLHEGDWRETLIALRDEGKIAGFGVSLFDHDVDAGLEAAGSGAIDSVQVMYHLFDQGAARALMPLCQEHGVAVIARSPFYYGILAGRTEPFAPGDWRSDYFFADHFRETSERVQRLARDAGAAGGGIADVALRFCSAHPPVSTVAVGVRTRAQLEANIAAVIQGPIDPEKRAAMAGHAWLC